MLTNAVVDAPAAQVDIKQVQGLSNSDESFLELPLVGYGADACIW